MKVNAAPPPPSREMSLWPNRSLQSSGTGAWYFSTWNWWVAVMLWTVLKYSRVGSWYQKPREKSKKMYKPRAWYLSAYHTSILLVYCWHTNLSRLNSTNYVQLRLKPPACDKIRYEIRETKIKYLFFGLFCTMNQLTGFNSDRLYVYLIKQSPYCKKKGKWDFQLNPRT